MVRHGKTKREELARAVGNLANVNARILGAILTLVPGRGGGEYAYSYYRAADGRKAGRASHRQARKSRRYARSAT
jgi:receptor protein-tyrosine kinase